MNCKEKGLGGAAGSAVQCLVAYCEYCVWTDGKWKRSICPSMEVQTLSLYLRTNGVAPSVDDRDPCESVSSDSLKYFI